MTYISSKENTKKHETQSFINKNSDLYAEKRNLLCHEMEEKDVLTEEETIRSKRNHYKKISSNYENLWKFEE